MQKILEKFMKKYWENAKKTGKVGEIRQSKKVGTMIRLTIICNEMQAPTVCRVIPSLHTTINL